jgi:hypothetical protein
MSEIRVDTISEKTSANGVAVDGVTLKDGAVTSTAASTITVADNSDNLTLTSTDADSNSGPNLRLYRNNDSNADGDVLGQIDFEGRNDSSQDVVYARIRAVAEDITDGTEDARLIIEKAVNGSTTEIMRSIGSETVFNDGSIDLDFRVESNGNANAIFVNAGTDSVTIGASGVTHFLGGIAVTSENNSIFMSDSDIMDTSDTAAFDTVYGWGAGKALTTGDSNTFMGYLAGAAVTTGQGNIMIGESAGDGFDTEGNNLGLGNGALGGSIAGGEYNVAIGNLSLDALTSADFNTAIGYQAGTAVTTGGNNTVVGYTAGNSMTDDTGNVLIGYRAGGA